MPNITPHPGSFIQAELDARGWTQRDLAEILGRTVVAVNEIIRGKRGITTEMAVALGEAFKSGAELWLRRETEYRLSLVGQSDGSIELRAKCYDLAPVKEMEKRQWIRPTKNCEQLEAELKLFFRLPSLEQEPELDVAMRAIRGDSLSPSQRAWCYRVRQLAESVAANEYREDRFDNCVTALRELAIYPHESSKVSEVLASFGIRMVVVEPLAGSKVDGVALWLDNFSPVVGISLRFGRIDGFWFTLCHELSHIRHRHNAPLDVDMSDQILVPMDVRPAVERQADEDAAEMLIPKKELDSFVLRYSPLYSKEKIHGFARRIKIHPGIVVGQLQHRGEVSYRANKEMLTDIRDFVTAVALTDGWGNQIGPEVFK